MKKLLSITENLRKAVDHQRVQASADAMYDEEKGELTVSLKLSDEPNPCDIVRSKVVFAEADPAVREIFHFWIQRLVKGGTFLVEE